MKLALGTVQFGLDYGVSNTKGKTDLEEVQRILSLAWDFGVDTLDTAYHYGDSEVVIGNLKEVSQDFRIITKTIIFDDDQISSSEVQMLDRAFHQSLIRLQRESVEGLLIHRVTNLFEKGGEQLYKHLVQLRESGKVKKIGASLYTPEQANLLIESFDIDIVQIPLNLMDQRMLTEGILERFKANSIEVHVRSLFLQGLFFITEERMPPTLQGAWPFVKNIQEQANDLGVSVAALSLGFVKDLSAVDRIVIGVNTTQQLLANLQDYQRAGGVPLDFSELRCDNPDFIDPSRWKL